MTRAFDPAALFAAFTHSNEEVDTQATKRDKKVSATHPWDGGRGEMAMQGPPIIVGMGRVGQATAYQLLRAGFPKVIGVDIAPRRRIPSWMPREYRSRVDWRTELPIVQGGHYFLCLPTPTNVPSDEDARWSSGGPQDTTAIEQTLYALGELRCKVILRSTVLPQRFKTPAFARVDYAWPLIGDLESRADVLRHVKRPEYDVVGARNINLLAAWPFTPEFGHDRAPKQVVGFGTLAEAMAFAYIDILYRALRQAFVNELEDCLDDAGLMHDSSAIQCYFGVGKGDLRPQATSTNREWREHIAAFVGMHRHRAIIADAIPYSNLLRGVGNELIQLRFPPSPLKEPSAEEVRQIIAPELADLAYWTPAAATEALS